MRIVMIVVCIRTCTSWQGVYTRVVICAEIPSFEILVGYPSARIPLLAVMYAKHLLHDRTLLGMVVKADFR